MSRVLVVALVTLLLAVGPVSADPEQERVVEVTYVSPQVWWFGICSPMDSNTSGNIMCADIEEGDKEVRVEVADVTGLPVGGIYWFSDTDLGYTPFCETIHVEEIPEGATDVTLMLHSIWSDDVFLPNTCETKQAPTTGTATFTFTTR